MARFIEILSRETLLLIHRRGQFELISAFKSLNIEKSPFPTVWVGHG